MIRSVLSISTIILAGVNLNVYPQPESTPVKPNVLFIVFDDLNDWVGPFGGNPQTKTPNFDRLAAMNAMVMMNAQSPGTVCCPSRSSLLTGLRPSTTGVYGNQQNLSFSPVAAAVPTMPQYFSRNGYFTISRGKVFHSHILPNGKTDYGQWAFDLWEKTEGGFKVDNSKIPYSGLPSDGPNQLDWAPTLISKQETMDWKTAEWAADKIKAGFSKPFFMMVGFSKPHLPWYVPQEYFSRFDLNSIITPLINENDFNDILTTGGKIKFTPDFDYINVKKANLFKDVARAYLACASYADDCLGIVLDALENSLYKDNTIVVVTGDHGWYLGEKMRFGKTMLWEEACRVPLIVKTPNMAAPTKTKAVVNLIDLYPTLAELCGLPVPEHCEGRSFVPVLQNPEISPWYPSLTTDQKSNHSLRNEEYRYIRWADGTEELYDHYVDSMEWNNLVKDIKYASVVNDLKAYLPTINAPNSPKDNEITSTHQENVKGIISVFPSVFPNPAQDFITLRVDKLDGHRHCRIVDLSGKLLESVIIKDYETTIPIAKLDNGVYLLQLYHNNINDESIKFIKEKN